MDFINFDFFESLSEITNCGYLSPKRITFLNVSVHHINSFKKTTVDHNAQIQNYQIEFYNNLKSFFY